MLPLSIFAAPARRAAVAARTTHAGGSLVAGYRLSFLIGMGMAVLAAVIVAAQLRVRRTRAAGPA